MLFIKGAISVEQLASFYGIDEPIAVRRHETKDQNGKSVKSRDMVQITKKKEHKETRREQKDRPEKKKESASEADGFTKMLQMGLIVPDTITCSAANPSNRSRGSALLGWDTSREGIQEHLESPKRMDADSVRMSATYRSPQIATRSNGNVQELEKMSEKYHQRRSKPELPRTLLFCGVCRKWIGVGAENESISTSFDTVSSGRTRSDKKAAAGASDSLAEIDSIYLVKPDSKITSIIKAKIERDDTAVESPPGSHQTTIPGSRRKKSPFIYSICPHTGKEIEHKQMQKREPQEVVRRLANVTSEDLYYFRMHLEVCC